MNQISQQIVIAGGGHAGIEAALAASRMGIESLIVTIDPEAIGRMSCNPAIGGLAKGHIVKEIDAMGGIMGLAADKSGLQFKMLNRSKGRAVWSPRAQVDKLLYSAYVKSVVERDENISVLAGEVVDFNVDNNSVSSVVLRSGDILKCSRLIITSGTLLLPIHQEKQYIIGCLYII